MSFRIDDILKQNTSREKINTSIDNNSLKSDISINFHTCLSKDANILECSLANKNYFTSYGHQELLNKYPVNCDQSSSTCPDSYFTKAENTRFSYTRDYVWSNYMQYPILFNCQHLHNRRKGGQIRFTTSQTEELEKQFNSHKYLSPEDRKQLAEFLRLSDRQVKTWFQNRRAKWRRNNQIHHTTRSNDLSTPLNIGRNSRLPEVHSKICDIKYF